MHTRAVVLLFLTIGGAPLRAADQLEMSVSPKVAFEPAVLTVRATIDANDDYRTMEIVAESDDYFRSSQVQLDGHRAPRTTLVSFRSLPGGSYTLRVTVRGSRGETIVHSERVATIVNRGADR